MGISKSKEKTKKFNKEFTKYLNLSLKLIFTKNITYSDCDNFLNNLKYNKKMKKVLTGGTGYRLIWQVSKQKNFKVTVFDRYNPIYNWKFKEF